MRNATTRAPQQRARGRRSAEATNLSFVSENPDHRMEFMLIDYTVPEIDPTIQREQVVSEINRIAANFNPAALGVFTVSVREVEDPESGETVARWFLVDAQQRQAACIKVGYDQKVPAIVHYGLTKEDEARLFLDLNDREGVGAWDKFKARLQAQEAQAVAIQDIIDDLEIPVGPPHGFMAITAADRVYTRGTRGPANLRFALSLLKELYNEYDGRAITGLALLYDEFHQFLDLEVLRRKLQEHVPTMGSLIMNAQTVKQLHGGTSGLAFAEAIVTTYNRQMRLNAKNSKALPSLYLGRRFKPTKGDLDDLAARHAVAADQDIDDSGLDDEGLDY